MIRIYGNVISLWKIYKKIEDYWFKLHEKLRFLLVGGFNTLLAYLLFASLYEIAGIDYNLSLIIQYVITVNVSIFTMRYYVFRSKGNIIKEFIKAWNVYIFMFFFNALMLNYFVRVLLLPPLLAQALYLTLSTIITFLLHKNLSFKKKQSKN